MPSSAHSTSAPLPQVPPLAISQTVGDAAAGRGLEYARRERVTSLDWDREAARVTAEVDGQGDRYRVVVELREYEADAVSRRFWRPTAGGVWRPAGSRCTCPVSRDCKHVAAALYALNTLAPCSPRTPRRSPRSRSRCASPSPPPRSTAAARAAAGRP